MSLKVPESNDSPVSDAAALPETRIAVMGGHQIVRYDLNKDDPRSIEQIAHLFRDCMFVLIGTSTAGKTSITRQLQKEVPGIVPMSLDDYVELHGPEMDAELLQKHLPEIYEALASALDSPKDIAYAVFDDKEVRWKPSVSQDVLEKAQKALKTAKEIKDTFPHFSMDAMKERMMDESIDHSSKGYPVVLDLWRANDADLLVQRLLEKGSSAPLKRGLAYCPFHVLSERVRKRNDDAEKSGNIGDCRNPLIPLDQFCEFYKPAESGDEVIDVLHKNNTIGNDGVEEAFESAFQQRLAMLQPDIKKDLPREIEEKNNQIAELKHIHDDWKKHIMDGLGFSEGVTEVPITLKNKRIDYIFYTHVLACL